MKHYATAREILEASLRDIENGGWLCGKLATSTFDGETFEGCFIPEDKPMGCALGLIATHGGHGHATEVTLKDGKTYETFVPAYPSLRTVYSWPDKRTVVVEEASEAVLEARDALALATGRTSLSGDDDYYDEEYESEPDVSHLDTVVYEHNDEMRSFVESAGAEKAAAWFRDAIETLTVAA